MDERHFIALYKKLRDDQATRTEVTRLMQAIDADPEMASLFRDLVQQDFEGTAGAAGSNAAEDALLRHKLNAQWQQIRQRAEATGTRDQQAREEVGLGITPETNLKREEPAVQLPTSLHDAVNGTQKSRRMQYRYSAVIKVAAIMLLVLGLGWGLRTYLFSPELTGVKMELAKNPPQINKALTPGTNAAILTLDNGEQVSLDSTAGRSIKRDEKVVANNRDGQLNYQRSQLDPALIRYNTLSTHRANQYQLVLPDGTRVWLNAESSIRYPTSFAIADRTVELTGEAFFEVEHNVHKPFRVKVGGQVIEDIGTSFNINAYGNEPTLRTTLVEGALRIQQTILHPGEQAIVNKTGRLRVRQNVDIEQTVAWKNGLFIFHKTDMKSILRQVARWYNVEIVYAGDFNETFTGGISRQANAEDVLKILSYSERVKFSIEGRKIVVRKSH